MDVEHATKVAELFGYPAFMSLAFAYVGWKVVMMLLSSHFETVATLKSDTATIKEAMQSLKSEGCANANGNPRDMDSDALKELLDQSGIDKKSVDKVIKMKRARSGR